MVKKQTIEDNEIFLTAAGIEELKKELSELVEKKQPELVKRVARARDFGDLMENSEYSAAREELAFVEGRITELEDVLNGAKVIVEQTGKGKGKAVALGSKVTIDIKGQKHVFTVVGEWEADPIAKKISHSSPLGKALLGKGVGDKVEVEAPAGKILYKIVKID